MDGEREGQMERGKEGRKRGRESRGIIKRKVKSKGGKQWRQGKNG